MEIKSFSDLTTPDGATFAFTDREFAPGAPTSTTEVAAEYLQQEIADADLHSNVPEDVRQHFEQLRLLHTYGVFRYEFFTIAVTMSSFVLEHALRARFVTYFAHKIPLVRTKSPDIAHLLVHNFDDVDTALRRGPYAKGWRLKVLATGEPLIFKGSLPHLLRWAREESLLPLTLLERNSLRRSEGFLGGNPEDDLQDDWMLGLHTEVRNMAAHPTFTLITDSNHSALRIRDLAEIVNRLWGHPTVGGRLYPAPCNTLPPN